MRRPHERTRWSWNAIRVQKWDAIPAGERDVAARTPRARIEGARAPPLELLRGRCDTNWLRRKAFMSMAVARPRDASSARADRARGDATTPVASAGLALARISPFAYGAGRERSNPATDPRARRAG